MKKTYIIPSIQVMDLMTEGVMTVTSVKINSGASGASMDTQKKDLWSAEESTSSDIWK